MESITLEQARNIVYEYAHPSETEQVSLYDAAGRYLAEDLYADISQPPFRRSAMDGYAVRSVDVAGASEDHPAELTVIYKSYAGDAPGRAIGPGEAVRIMTGAAVPDGADCVVQQERTDYGEDKVLIFGEVKKEANCCPIGEDFLKGTLLLKKGDRIDCYGCATAAAAGNQEIAVCRRPRVLLITTGDELCEPGAALLPGKIYDSNAVYLRTRLRELGCKCVGVVRAGDDIEKICTAIRRCTGADTHGEAHSLELPETEMSGAGASVSKSSLLQAIKPELQVSGNDMVDVDLIITTGGVSVGQKDFLPVVIEQLHGECLFHGIQLKPGMPTMFSRIGRTPVLSLSGNPYSAIAVFELLMQPFLQKSRGTEQREERRTAVAADTFPKKSPARRMIRGRLHGMEVRFSEEQRNGQLLSGTGTNCLIDIPAGSDPVHPGDEVEVILLEESFFA